MWFLGQTIGCRVVFGIYVLHANHSFLLAFRTVIIHYSTSLYYPFVREPVAFAKAMTIDGLVTVPDSTLTTKNALKLWPRV